MDFSLSNSLVSTAVLDADKLSLNLQFATDKTLTARKGPTPTFTRASTATFVGSDGLIQSAAVNAARFDHNPTTLASLGLLIEESRTNLILQSQTFGTTWTATQLNTTGTPAYLNVATAPDGTTTADKIIGNVGISTHQFRQSATLVSGTTYSLTCYFKEAEQQFASMALNGVANGNADWIALFNVSSSPSVGYFVGFTSNSVTNAGNGWVRCTAVFTATASGAISIRIGGAGNALTGGQAYLGDNSSGILVWGAQLEAGAFPTSYIPTTTASVVRSVDICSITGAAFTGMYNTTEGTLFATASTFSPNTNIRRIVFATDGAITNRAGLLFNSAGFPTTFVASSGGSLSALIAVTVASVTSPVKIVGAYKLDDFAISANGGAINSDNLGAVGVGINRLNIGSQNDTEPLNGHIASIRYFKKRLANAKLQSITA